MKMKRIMGFFLALVMFLGCLPLNPIASYANGDVEINDKNFPDKNFRKYVKRNFDKNPCDGKLSKDELDKVTEISIEKKSVSSLKGIEHFTKLTELKCNNNELTELNVSKNTNLTKLNCEGNKLSKLDVSKNKNLTYLKCACHELTSLDVSKNKNLTYLNCYGSNLTSLDVSNNINLAELWCGNNNLTSLDLSNNINLTELYCFHNKLESLDLSKNTKLTDLWCYENNLTSLDLSNNINLELLKCSGPNLTSLDLSKNTKLSALDCYASPLTSVKLVRREEATSSTYRFVDNPLPAEYTVEVENGSRKVPFNKLPQGFDKSRIKSDVKLEEDGFVWDGSTFPICFRYQLCENPNEVVKPEIALAGAYINVKEVVAMKVTKQPKKLIYTEGEKLDLTGLVVTLEYNQGPTKDVEFKDFKENNIKVNPENEADLTLTDNNKPVTLTKGNLKAKTANLTVNEKVFDPENVVDMKVKTQPTKLSYTEGEKLDLTGLVVTLEDNQGLTKEVEFKYFNGNNIKVKPENETELKLEHSGKPVTLTKGSLKAETANLTVNKKETPSPLPTPKNPPVVGPVDPTDSNGGKPADTSKYWTVTFKSEDETKGTVDAKNTVYVLKTENKTLADITAPEKTAKAGYEFDKWEPALNNATTINKDMTVKAYFKASGTIPTPKNPPVVGPVDSIDSNTKKSQVANNRKLPKTANSMNIELYTIFMILSGALLVVAFKRKKRVNR